MRAAVDVIPPVQFAWYWLPIALGVIALLVAWYLLIPLIARRSTRGRPAESLVFTRNYEGPLGARDRAWAAIAAVEQDARSGAISVREAHLQLSAIVREFAWDMTRIDARTMTLTELRATGFAPIADAVAQFYPIAFQEQELTELGGVADVARGAVASWS